ncbi:MAG: hypothetical protein ACE5EQ_03235 [Phycisphaerae bacterium]
MWNDLPELPDWTGYVVGPILLLTAAWFWWGPSAAKLPESKAAIVDPSRLTTAPRRTILHDPPVIDINGFRRTCMECHRTFPVRQGEPRKLIQHANVVLHHGINKRCHNCHYESDRDRLVLLNGKDIGYDQVVELCAQCHDPTYRDWQRGAHGRTNGYWDAKRGEVKRLGCTECHNPHNPRVPAMDPLEPLPGPHTLRMGVQRETEHIETDSVRDPLRKFRSPEKE